MSSTIPWRRSSYEKRDSRATLEVAGRLGPDARVVTLVADTGLEYLSPDVFRRS
jgi:hypothetical protein